jgi:quinol monooxygenase YgiN
LAFSECGEIAATSAVSAQTLSLIVYHSLQRRFKRKAAPMLINSVFYTFPEDEAEHAAELLGELRDLARVEAGCLSFDVSRSMENPNIFVLYEEYVDEEALKTHIASEPFKRLVINGFRPLATERVGHICLPLN